MTIISRSSQSTSTRVLVLAAIYALILISFPYARHLTAVRRLPIDSDAIQAWSHLSRKTGCPTRIPASIGISYDQVEARDHSGWSADTRSQTEALLQLASEGDDRSHAAASRWCVQWQVNWAQNKQDTDVANDFSYRIGDLRDARNAKAASPLFFNLTEPLASFSPQSVASALAKRIASDLYLPHRNLLAQNFGEGSRTSGNSRDGEQDIAPPAAASQAAAQGIHTAPPASDASSAARPHDYIDAAQDLLSAQESSVEVEDSFPDVYSQDRPLDLPSHLLLHFHLLNEDLALDNSTHPPLDQRFRSRIREQLRELQSELKSLTTIGYSADWGIGKAARGIKWEEINWTANRTWEEQIEVAEEREVECELDTAADEEAETESVDDEEEASTGSAPSPVSRPMCIERYNSSTTVPRSESIEKRAYSLPQDQMETFVDESGWGLDSQQGSGQVETFAPFPYLFEPRSKAGIEHSGLPLDVTTLHFVLYNPSSGRRPIVYSGEQDHYEDSSEAATTPASEGGLLEAEQQLYTPAEEERRRSLAKVAEEQEGQESTWGWVVPSWGGVVMLPSHSHQDTHGEVAELVQRQLLALLGLPLSLDERSLQQKSKVSFHLRRLTVLNRLRDAIDTLESVYSSLSKLSNLEVGTSVQSSVASSLDALHRISAESSETATGSSLTWADLAALSLVAKSSASLAFYNPRMVGQLYFPVEHRYAVFTPLFGPLAVPLLLAGLKEVRKAVKKRRARKKKTSRMAKKSDGDESAG